MRAALRLFLALSLVLSSSGTPGFVLFAQEKYDPDSNQFKPVAQKAAVQAPVAADQAPVMAAVAPRARLEQAQKKIREDKRLGEAQKEQALAFLDRYQDALTHDEETAKKVLDEVVKDLNNPDRDPGLALAGLFDRFSETSRTAENRGVYVQYLEQTSKTTRVRVGNSLLGRTLYYQTGTVVDPRTTLKTITRPGPDEKGPEVVEAIIREERKGAATEQRVLYNRRVHQLFSNLKKLYYDQCGLVRRINNGETIIKETPCKEPTGYKDPKVTEDVRRKLSAFYERNRLRFPKDLLAYLEKLDKLKAEGRLGELNDYKELERMQRLAMFFYNQNQLETYQRAVISEITTYMSVATGVQPKSERGADQLDLNARELSKFQALLDQFRKGNMEGYSSLLGMLGWSDLDENEKRVLAPRMMALAAEAFADVAYAAKAQERLLDPEAHLTGPEREAVIEEAGQWLRLAAIQIQSFQIETQAMSIMKLTQGKLRGIGIDESDTAMIARGEALAKTAREEYFPKLQAANMEAKQLMIRQTVAAFYTTYRDTVDAYLYNASLKDRVRLLAGKADQILALYLSREFDKASADAAFMKRFSAVEKVQAGMYQAFLDNPPEQVAKLKAKLEAFRDKLRGYDRSSVAEVAAGLKALDAEFKAIAKELLGSAEIPLPHVIQKEAQAQSVKHGRIFAAAADFTNNMRLFDLINELHIYVDKYASSKGVTTKADTFWTKLASFEWLNTFYEYASFGTREKAADLMMSKFHVKIGSLELDCREAFEMLKGNPQRRAALDKALREGDFKKVMELAASIDPKGAERMKKQAQLDKLDEDPNDLLDLDGLLSRQMKNDDATGALGGVVGAFNNLPKLIMGYAAATAVTDMVITTVLTAVGGPLISYASRAATGLVSAGKFLTFIKPLDNAADVSRTFRVLHFLSRSINVFGGAFEYVGKVILNSGRTFRKVLALPEAVTPRAAARQIFLASTWENAVRSTVHSTLMMGGISAGMQGIHHASSPMTSQYASAGDAMAQGFVQGAAFGAKANIITHISPVPASAFSGRVGGLMRTVAESPGPINFLTQKVAQITPGLSKTAVAEAGALGAVSQITLNSSGTMYAASKMLVWGGGIIDGTLKYMTAAWLPQQIVQVGSMLYGKATDKRDPGAETASGSTVYVERLSDAQAFSMTFAQISWVLLPSNPAFSRKEIADQVSAARGYNRIINGGPEAVRELAMAPNGREITYVKPWYQRSIGEHLMNAIGTVVPSLKPAKSETLVVNEQWRALANKKLAKTMSTEQLIALSQAPGEGMNKVVNLSRLTTGLSDPAALREFLKSGGATKGEPNAEGLLITTPGSKDPVDVRNILVRDPVTKRWRLANEGEARIVERPATKPGENTTPRVLEVIDPKTGQFVPAGTPGTLVAKIQESGQQGQVRITNESVSAAKGELESRMSGSSGKALRERILLSGERLELGEGVVLTGSTLAGLKKTAAMVHLEGMPATRNPLRAGWEMAGRAWESLFGTKLESQQVRQGRYLREEVQAEAEKIAKSPETRVEVVRQQLTDLLGPVGEPADRAVLERVKKALEMKAPAADVVASAVKELDAAAGAKTPGAGLFAELAQALKSETLSPQKRIDAASGRITSALGLSNASDRAVLERVTKILSSAPSPKEGVKKAVVELDAAAAGKTEKSTGLIGDAYKNLSATLNGEVTADLVMIAARRKLDQRIAKAEGADAAALQVMRQALETDASRQVVISHMLKAFGGKQGSLVGAIEEAAARKDEAALDRAIDLYTQAWERAAFGQMAGERVLGKDGKTLEWSIPAANQFKNRFDATIAEFRPLQKRVIKETLGFISEGHTLIFGQMPTGGGKTLTNFTLIEFLEALAKKQGREGVIYLTTNPDLVAQAKEDYMAFFGKKPNFEVMTYGDLSARVAQAKEQGLPSPLSKFHLVGDEGDRPASEVPTSVGLFNGGMTKAAIDPVQRAMQDAAGRLVDGKPEFWKGVRAQYNLGEGEISASKYRELLQVPEFRKAIEAGEGGFYRQVTAKFGEKYGLQGRIADHEFRTLMKDKEFVKDINSLVKGTDAEISQAYKRLKSSEFRDSIDVTKYPEYLALFNGNAKEARAELQRTMIAEYKHMVHTANLLHGSLSGRLQKFYKGGLEFASEPERSQKIIPDPDPSRGVINFNNGIAYDNLSTDVGPFGAAYFRRPISNEFESAGQLDFAGLIKEAVTHKSVFFLTSGTCASKIREILITRFGAKFTGETSIADPYRPRLVRAGEDFINVKEKMEFIRSGKDGPNLSVTYVNSLEESEAVFKAFAKATDPSRISVLVRPGSALEEQERFSQEVKFERNLGAFERGEAEVVIIVGAAGLRGLEMNLKKYMGRQSWMDIVAPERMDTDSMIQLIGRLSIGRAWMLNLRRFTSTSRAEDLAANPMLKGSLKEMLEIAEGAHGRGDLEAAVSLSAEIMNSPMFKGQEYAPADLLAAIKLREADTQRMFAEIAAWDKGPKEKPFAFEYSENKLYKDVILPMLKNPSELDAGKMVTRIVEVLKFREGLKGELKTLMELPPADRQAALEALLKDPAVLERPEVLDVVITTLGRGEQEVAIGSSGITEAKAQTGPANVVDWATGLIRTTPPPTPRTP